MRETLLMGSDIQLWFGSEAGPEATTTKAAMSTVVVASYTHG